MTTAKTNAQRQADFRARRASTPEVRGIYARPEDHAAIKKAAAKITKSRPASHRIDAIASSH